MARKNDLYLPSNIVYLLIDNKKRRRMRKMITLLFLVLLVISQNIFADCVYGAKYKTSYTVLGNHAIILKGGSGADILIKSFSFFYPSSDVTVLKDSFCSYDSAVLYVDGETVDANQVERLD